MPTDAYHMPSTHEPDLIKLEEPSPHLKLQQIVDPKQDVVPKP